jgi:hypothetical protein
MGYQYRPPPELRDFIDRAIVPALLDRFLREMKAREAERAPRGSHSPVASTPGQV